MTKTILMWRVIMAVVSACLIAPFVSFGHSLDTVRMDAAAMFGIPEERYSMTFQSGRVLNAHTGDMVNGTFQRTFIELECGTFESHYRMQVQNSIMRPMTVSTIFHEFGHAAVREHGIWRRSESEYTEEQFVEKLAFQMMWNSGYWWNAIHMSFMHSFGGKPREYRAPATIWSTIFTGKNAVKSSASYF